MQDTRKPSPLRLQRWCAGLTLLDLQIKTGVPATRLSLVERGLAELSPCERELIADTLGVTVTELFGTQSQSDVAGATGRRQELEAAGEEEAPPSRN